jgi:EmrB/QacA subfamily drug resistance transporter
MSPPSADPEPLPSPTTAGAQADRDDPGRLRLDGRGGTRVIATTVLGSSITMLTATVVSLALPSIARTLGASSAAQQWILTGYLLAMSSTLMAGGALGDRFGRVRVYRAGIFAFSAASLLCAAAPGTAALIAARVLQGLGAALMIPGSLAIIEATIRPEDRGRAVGSWSGLSGIAGAVGPFVGGAVIDWSWRWVFVLVLPLAVLALALSLRIPESFDRSARGAPLDLAGTAYTVTLLGGVSFALIEGPEGLGVPWLAVSLGIAALSAVALARREQRIRNPIVPLDLFRIRPFVGANLVTLLVYGGMGVMFFVVPLQLQVTLGWSPVRAGASMVPITLMMLVASSAAGALAQRIGPRWPLTVGPLVIAGGMLLLGRIGPTASSVLEVVLAVTVTGLGMAISVAPVTATALGAVPDERAGAASGLNNAVSGFGQTLAVAAVPPLAGLTGSALADPRLLAHGYPMALAIAASLVAAAAPVAAVMLAGTAPDAGTRAGTRSRPRAHCGVESPGLAPSG